MFNSKKWQQVFESFKALELQVGQLKHLIDTNTGVLNHTRADMSNQIRSLNLDIIASTKHAILDSEARFVARLDNMDSLSSAQREKILAHFSTFTKDLETNHKQQMLALHTKFVDLQNTLNRSGSFVAAPKFDTGLPSVKPVIEEITEPVCEADPILIGTAKMTAERRSKLIGDLLKANTFANNTEAAKQLLALYPDTYTLNTWKSYVARHKKDNPISESSETLVVDDKALVEKTSALSASRVAKHLNERGRGFIKKSIFQSSVDRKNYYGLDGTSVVKRSIRHTEHIGNMPNIIDRALSTVNQFLVDNPNNLLDLTLTIGEADLVSDADHIELASFFAELRELGHRISVYLGNNVKGAYSVLQGFSAGK